MNKNAKALRLQGWIGFGVRGRSVRRQGLASYQGMGLSLDEVFAVGRQLAESAGNVSKKSATGRS
jgi:hypothetical protein